MCKLCRATPEGERLYNEYKAAEQAVRDAGLNPGVGGFMQRYNAKEVVGEQPTNDDLFGGDKATVLDRYNAAKDLKSTYHNLICKWLADPEVTTIDAALFREVYRHTPTDEV